MTKQLDWDAYRYVLEDPSLDRPAFEARMLADVELALAVAEAVSHIDALRAASSIVPPPRPSRAAPGQGNLIAESKSTGGWHWSTLAALAATLLLVVGLANYLAISDPADPAQRSSRAVGEQRLAESWLALRQAELVDVSSNLVDVSSNSADALGLESLRYADTEQAEAVVSDVASEGDWLLDAAQEFFAEREAS